MYIVVIVFIVEMDIYFVVYRVSCLDFLVLMVDR